ncbi:MAG: SIMPL domain-containing protein [Solirubrobacteraceae bacterium]|jgi:uncharacterized protein YggE
MPRPRTTLIALAAVLAGAALSGIGEAQADSSGSPATIVVNGTDTITLTGNPSDTTIQSTYQTALGGAITNAGQKATFIAGQINATLGSITNVTETSTSSDLCQYAVMYAKGGAPVPATAGTTTSTGHKKKKTKKTGLVDASTPATPIGTNVIVNPSDNCAVEADVTVTYTMTPAS